MVVGGVKFAFAPATKSVFASCGNSNSGPRLPVSEDPRPDCVSTPRVGSGDEESGETGGGLPGEPP